jgi:hypothetical protein
MWTHRAGLFFEPMDLANMHQNVRSLAVSPDRPLVGKRLLTGFGDRHPDNGNPSRAGAYRSRLDRDQPIAR